MRKKLLNIILILALMFAAVPFMTHTAYAATKAVHDVSLTTDTPMAGTSMLMDLTEALGEDIDQAYSPYLSRNQYNEIIEYDASDKEVKTYPLDQYSDLYEADKAATYVFKAGTTYLLKIKLRAAAGYKFYTKETDKSDFKWNGIIAEDMSFSEIPDVDPELKVEGYTSYVSLSFKFTTPSYKALPENQEIGLEFNGSDYAAGGKVKAGTTVSGTGAVDVFTSPDCTIKTLGWTNEDSGEDVTMTGANTFYRVKLKLTLNNSSYSGYGFTNTTKFSLPETVQLESICPDYSDGTAVAELLVPAEGGKYTVSVETNGYGTVYFDHSPSEMYSMNAGEKVYVTVKPEDGYYLSDYEANTEGDSGKFGFETGNREEYDWEFYLTCGEENVDLEFTFSKRTGKISYCNESGDIVRVQKAEIGSDVTLYNSIISKDGYKQTGWSKEDNGSTQDYTLGQTMSVNESMTLYPCYEEIFYDDPEAPEFGTEPGTYENAFYLTLSCETSGATIYYTTDGTEPVDSGGSSPVISAAAKKYDPDLVKISGKNRIYVNGKMTVNAVAEYGGAYSAIVAADYEITGNVISSASFTIKDPKAGETVNTNLQSEDVSSYTATASGSDAGGDDLGWYTVSGAPIEAGSAFESGVHYYLDFYVTVANEEDTFAPHGATEVFVNGCSATYVSGDERCMRYRVYYFNVAAENGKILNAEGAEAEYINPSSAIVLQAEDTDTEGKMFNGWQIPVGTVRDVTGAPIAETSELFETENAALTSTLATYAIRDTGTNLPVAPDGTMVFKAGYIGASQKLKVQGGFCGNTSNPYAGDQVTVKADKKEGKVFTGWTAEGVTLDDSQAAAEKITFAMPGNSVTLMANYDTLICSGNVQVEVPEELKTPQNAVTEESSFCIANTSWDPADSVFSAEGKTEAGVSILKSYTVTVCLKAEDGYQFDEDAVIYVDEMKAEIIKRTAKEVVISYTFPDGLPHIHKVSAVEKKAASISRDGNKAYYTCRDCKAFFNDMAGTVPVRLETVTIPKIGSIKLGAATYTYNGKTKSPALTIRDRNNKVLKKDVDYKVTVPSGRKSVGKYAYKITFIGNYSGTASASFVINPAAASIKSISSGKKMLTVKTSAKPAGRGGSYYQIAYKQKGTSKWKYATTSSTGVSLKSLKKGTTYYVKIRACKKVNKNTYYSAWSKTTLSKKIK